MYSTNVVKIAFCAGYHGDGLNVKTILLFVLFLIFIHFDLFVCVCVCVCVTMWGVWPCLITHLV